MKIVRLSMRGVNAHWNGHRIPKTFKILRGRNFGPRDTPNTPTVAQPELLKRDSPPGKHRGVYSGFSKLARRHARILPTCCWRDPPSREKNSRFASRWNGSGAVHSNGNPCGGNRSDDDCRARAVDCGH